MNYFIEISIVVLFLISICIAHKFKKLDVLIYSTLFALLFENLNIFLFHSTSGSYFYPNNFIMLLKVPLFVVLSWGIIILTSFIIAEKISNKKNKIIFLIPLFVIMLDLAFESSAVANKLWIWNLDLYKGFLTIPAENFIGWLLVSFSFSFSYLYLKKNYKWASVFTSYFLFIIFSIIPFTISEILKLNNVGNFILFFFMIIIFIYFALKDNLSTYKFNSKLEIKKYIIVILLRIPFYLFPLIVFNSWKNDKISIIIYFLILITEIIIHLIILKRKKIRY